MNFSYYLFLDPREDLAGVLPKTVRTLGLIDDGLFILDAYGGYDAPRDIT